MTKQTHFRTFQIKRNDNLSVPIGNLVWAQAFFERFGLDEVIRAFKTKGTDLAKLAGCRSSTCAAFTAPSSSWGGTRSRS